MKWSTLALPRLSFYTAEDFPIDKFGIQLQQINRLESVSRCFFPESKARTLRLHHAAAGYLPSEGAKSFRSIASAIAW
jgi:hypothetical protein